MGPDELVRIQVGGIAGEGLDVQPRTPGEEGAHVGTLVNAAAVPEDDDVPAELAEQGAAILMISSELPEILGMSDRIAVMRGGTIRVVLNRDEATQQRVLALALGQ